MEIDKSKDKEYRLPCKNCDGQTFHKVVASIDKTESDEIHEIHCWEELQIIICQGCKTLSFRKTSSNSEDFDCISNEGRISYNEREELYPSRIVGRRMLRNYYRLPSDIEKVYEETHSALCGRLTLLAGIGVRVLIEAVCNEEKTKGRGLEKKIDNLVSLGILSQKDAEILHSTRILGNKATHEAISLSERELDIAMDVVEHLLIGVYILPLKTKKMREKTQKPKDKK